MSSTLRRNLAFAVITAPAGVFIVQWIGITFFGWAALPWSRFALVSAGAYAIVVLVNLLEHVLHLFPGDPVKQPGGSDHARHA